MKTLTVRLLRAEAQELRARLAHGQLDHLDILTRSAERRSIAARLAEIDEELSDLEITSEGRAMAAGGLI